MSKNTDKPKILADVLPRGNSSVFKKMKDPLGRVYSSVFVLPRKWKNFAVIFLTVSVFLSFMSGHFSLLAPSAFSQISEAERQSLESELEKTEKEIDEYEKTILSLQNQKNTLNQSIKLLDAQIAKMDLQIKATDMQLRKLENEISGLKKNIVYTEGDIGKLKVFLAGSLRQINSDDTRSFVEMVLRNESISDFFGDLNNLSLIQEEMRKNLNRLVELKTNLVVQKDVLSGEREDVLNLKNIKESQKQQLNQKKKEKNDLMKITKGQESRYQDLLKKSKQNAAQIRSRIFELLGGGQLTFEEAYKLAKFASEQTGVRAALILAVLDRESNFGSNVGKCSWRTSMHPTRDQQIFLDLTKELGINPDSVSVSCANSDGAYGGAMGPAQFIPSTWVKYKDRISALTGSKPPSPWRNIDAFMATALYLKDVGAAGGNYESERKAAAMYYAGSRWKRYLSSYGQWVIERARRFENDIKDLNA